MSVEHEKDRLARVALSRLGEPGDLRMAGLVRDLGPQVVRDHLAGQRDASGFHDDVAQRLERLDPEGDLTRAAASGIRFVIPGDPEWPRRLDDLTHVDPVQERGGVPLGLWVRGPMRLDQVDAAVAIVGSRSATTYGVSVAGDLATGAALHDVAVISGAAYGIDIAAHGGALGVDGPTVAVLAGGVDRPYPADHRAVIERIAAVGAVISEAPPGCSPTRIRFLARNRLIAALARGTVVVEAAVRSGALNTANWTERLGRSLMAVPGPITSAPSQGAHALIRTGAALVAGTDDMLEIIGKPGEHLVTAPRARARPRDTLLLRDQQVLDAVPKTRPAAADSIARTAGIKLLDVQSALRRLHTKGLVAQGDGGWVLHEAALG